MKLCPQCRTRFDDTTEFCYHDGNLLEAPGEGTATASGLTCSRCKRPVELIHQFCPHCGVRLAADIQPRVAEEEGTTSAVEQGHELDPQTAKEIGLPKRAAESDASNQAYSDLMSQVLLLSVEEGKKMRRIERKRIAIKIGLGLLFIGGSVFAYSKAREWGQTPLPHEETATRGGEQGKVSSVIVQPPGKDPQEERSAAADIPQEQGAAMTEKEPISPPQEPPDGSKVNAAAEKEFDGGIGATAAVEKIQVSGKGAEDSARSSESIQRVLEAYIPQLQEVYERAYASDPALKGRLGFRLIINPNGRVSQVGLRSDKMTNWKFRKTVRSLASEWRFSPASRKVVVEGSFLFTPPTNIAAITDRESTDQESNSTRSRAY